MRPWGRNAIALVLCLASAGAADPPHYVKQATWQETLRLSREALIRQEAESAKALAADPAARAFEPSTAELKLGDKPSRLRVRVAGLKALCLRITRSGEKRRGRATVCFVRQPQPPHRRRQGDRCDEADGRPGARQPPLR